MHSYELTERGKIIIAVILVLLLLVIPAVILAVNAWSNTPPAEDPPSSAVPGPEEPPEISNGPLPNEGSGFNPLDPPQSDGGEQGSFDPPPEPPVEPPDAPPEEPPDDDIKRDPATINRSAGTMTFMFSPDLHKALDTDTISMLGDFVTSPQNTGDKQILVEMPSLSEDDTTTLITAVTDAFKAHGVSTDTLAFMTYQPVAGEQSYEIRLSFFTESNMK